MAWGVGRSIVAVMGLSFELIAVTASAHPVTVRLPDDVPLEGCALTVYGWSGDRSSPREISGQTLKKEKQVRLSLAKGDYTVEVSGLSKAGITVLRTRPFKVISAMAVSLPAVRVPVIGRIGGSDVPADHVTVRHLGSGQQWWNVYQLLPDKPDGPPMLTLSPGETYIVSCEARRKPTTLLLWRKVVATDGQPLVFEDTAATYDVSFEAERDTPPLRSSVAFLDFPDRQVTLNGPLAGGRLLTNRDRALLSYELATSAGERLRFSSQGQRFAAKSRLRLGGKLTPTAFAGPLGSAPDWEHWTDHLVKRVYLMDSTGRHVVLDRSDFKFTGEFVWNGGRIAHDGPDDTVVDFGKVHSRSITAKLSYTYGGRSVNVSVPCDEWTTYSTAHFKIDTPPALRLRAAAFLEMHERLRDILRASTGRPGPQSTYVKLRGDMQMAQAALGPAEGGGKDVWMALPLRAMEGFDGFTEPAMSNADPFIGHELLHTFGYNHGDEMKRIDTAAENAFRQLRWKAADTGVWAVWSDPTSVNRPERTR